MTFAISALVSYVVMEDDEGQPVHTYLAEAQITYELSDEHLDNDSNG